MYENGERRISVTLSPAQVEEVLRAASRGTVQSVSSLLASALGSGVAERATAGTRDTGRAGERPAPTGCLRGDSSDRRLSRSLLRGLSLLTCFGAAGEERGIIDISVELGMTASTAHRYALTLVELGLLERCPRSRKYRLADALSASEAAPALLAGANTARRAREER